MHESNESTVGVFVSWQISGKINWKYNCHTHTHISTRYAHRLILTRLADATTVATCSMEIKIYVQHEIEVLHETFSDKL